jgi:hypothetical protein
MFLVTPHHTCLLSEISDWRCQDNYKGGHWGMLYVTLKNGSKLTASYSEKTYGKKDMMNDVVMNHIKNNKTLILY